MRGFMRILEVLIVLMLLFTLMTAIVKQNPPVQQTRNIAVLQRYATDASNMLCNSDKARAIAMSGAAMAWISNSLTYSLPEDIQYSVIVVNITSGDIIKSTGASIPEDTDIATASCQVTRWGLPPRQMVVRVWR
ncbi:MAG: hypothetical protein KAW41_04665 [Candidatus Diapherotrites archaeon]|nr:hypothetical protein [Candidatus Diapherotrites archaeon]